MTVFASANNATTDPKEIAGQIRAAFEAFRAEHDAALKGKANAETVDNINAAITELQTQLDRVVQDQQRASLGGLTSPAASRDAVIRAQQFLRAANRPAEADNPQEAYRVATEYEAAFDRALRARFSAQHMGDGIRAAMSVGSDPDGGYLVPAEMSTAIERRVFDTSPMRQIATVVTIGSYAWEAPYAAQDATSGGWVAERAARPATATAQVGLQRIEAHEQYAYPEITQQMLDDAAFDVRAFVADQVMDKMTRTENAAFVSGNGVGKPTGFLHYSATAVTTADASRDWGKLQYVAAGAAGAFPALSSGASNPDALIDVVTALNPVYRTGARWAMNRKTEAAVRKLKDAEGRYLVGMTGGIDTGLAFDLHGYPIVNMEDMPDVGSDAFAIAFGNWARGYYIVDRLGMRMLVDPYTNKPFVGYYMVKRTGGDVRNFDAIKLLKFAAS